MKGLPLRVYLDLEAARKPTGLEDIFIGYHAQDDVQVTYAGKSFHTSRNYHLSTEKRNVSLSNAESKFHRIYINKCNYLHALPK
jgi:alpha-1,4-fucosyltransferase